MTVEHLCFSYPCGRKILEDISFAADAGECLAVLGNNGAGKSTLLKCFSHILRPQSGRVLVDGLGVGDVGSIVLRDRKHLAQDGLIVVVVALESQSGQIMAGPDIVSRGFVYVREAEEMMNEARRIARDSIERCCESGAHDWANIKMHLKDDLSDYFYTQTKRSPMILPVIQQI